MSLLKHRTPEIFVCWIGMFLDFFWYFQSIYICTNPFWSKRLEKNRRKNYRYFCCKKSVKKWWMSLRIHIVQKRENVIISGFAGFFQTSSVPKCSQRGTNWYVKAKNTGTFRKILLISQDSCVFKIRSFLRKTAYIIRWV